jgi:nucleosome assembly protein 1-like 1
MAAPFRNQPVDLTAPYVNSCMHPRALLTGHLQDATKYPSKCCTYIFARPAAKCWQYQGRFAAPQSYLHHIFTILPLTMSKVDELDARALGALAQNPAMVALMHSKLNSLIGQSSGYVESLPAEVRNRITGLKGIQVEHSKLEARLQEEVLELEKKYFQLFTPLYEKRAKIVNGSVEPSEEEVAVGKAKEAEKAEEDDEEDDEEEATEKAEETQPAADAKPMVGIPEFWLTSMKTNPSLQEMITDEDEAVLRHLTDIRMEYLEKPGFKLIFEFSENEFFSEKILTKTYYYREENGYGGDFIYDHAEGGSISWKPNKNLTVRVESKKQRNKSMLSLSLFP